MVCSGRVPDVRTSDDFSEDIDENYEDEERSDLMEQLALLDEEASDLETQQKSEILEALGIDPTGSEMSRREEEEFLTEELFLDLEVEIAELEKLSKKKAQTIDSLQLELQEADYQLAALQNIVPESGRRLASKSRPQPSFNVTNGTMSEYEMSYQDALNEVYAHNYTRAIDKFRDLLKFDDTDNLADNCQYWIGECYYALSNYQLAIAEFEKVFAFDNNNKDDDAQFMIGMAYLRLGDSNLARLELSNLLTFYGKSEYVARAERQLLELNI